VKFFLDQNVDAEVAATLREFGHEVWTAAEAALGDVADDELTVYAHNKKAVLITHDVEFSQRRSRNVIGQHIWLRCAEFEAAELLRIHIEDVVALLNHGRDVWLRVSKEGLTLSRRWE
jgi:predicted nuclease of predicted toxin-antitoxin system